MKLITPCYLALTLSLLSASALFQSAYAVPTPANQDALSIHTGIPRKVGDSLFSYTAEWRMDDGELYRATGLSFLNAAKIDAVASGASVTKKLVTSMKDGMIQMDPSWRGITVNQNQDQPELTIANKAGYSITTVIIRDYTNQPMRYNLSGKSFNAEGVQVAIDLVLSANVEYLDGFSSRKSRIASQGGIDVTIDDQKTIHIKMKNCSFHCQIDSICFNRQQKL